MSKDDYDNDTLEAITHHYLQTACSGRIPGLILLHYSDMSIDARATLRHLADAVGIDADDALIEAIARATGIREMRAKAERYAPVGGTGFWKSDAAFFGSGGTGNWKGQLTDNDLAAYGARLRDLVPDPGARRWLEEGSGRPFQA